MALALLAVTALLAQPQPPVRAARPSAAARPAAAATSPRDLKYPPLAPIPAPKVESFTLANGIKLYLIEDHELPLVAGTAMVRTGNLFDPGEKIGLATLTGMTIRTGGTISRTGDELAVELENIAATIDSEIGESSGAVTFSALKAGADRVLALFHEVLTAPAFRQDKLDLAKARLHNLVARRNDNPDGIARMELLARLVGKDTPYGWAMQHATIDRINRGDVQRFYRRYFFPANTLLGLFGDFDAAEMKARVEKLFAGWTVQQPAVPEFPKVGPAPAGGTFLAVKADVTRTFFALGQRGGELRDKDYPALVVMGTILGGGGFPSRLSQRLAGKAGNAYEIAAGWGANFDHPGVFNISGSVKSLSTVDTIKAIREEVERLRTTEVTDEELKGARDAALSSLVFAFDNKVNSLNRILAYEYFGYPGDFVQKYQSGLAAVTRADVLRVARERLDPARFTVVAVGNPQDFGTQLDALGSPVAAIDLAIPPSKTEAAATDTASLAKGKEILLRAQQAVGGADRLAAVKDSVRIGQLNGAATAVQVKQTEQWISPSNWRRDQERPGARITVYWDGKAGWVAAPQVFSALDARQNREAQMQAFREYFPLLLSDRLEGRTVSALDETTVEISDKNGNLLQLVTDSETGLPAKVLYREVDAVGASNAVEEDFSDFRVVSGIKMPHKIGIFHNGQKFADVTVTETRLNSGLKVQDLGRRP